MELASGFVPDDTDLPHRSKRCRLSDGSRVASSFRGQGVEGAAVAAAVTTAVSMELVPEPALSPAPAPQPRAGDPAPELLHQAFDRIAEVYADRPAVEDSAGRTWTYAELRDASIRMAQGLAATAEVAVEDEQGTSACLRSPPVIASLMARTCSWVAACIAVMRLGSPLLALSGDLRTDDEAKRNRDAIVEHQPCVLVVDSGQQGVASALLAEVSAAALGSARPVLVDADALLAAAGQAPAPRLLQGVRPSHGSDSALYLVYTGGTTSASKCVAVTHRMALHELDVYPQIAPLRCTDRVLHQTSAYWGATSLGIFDIAWACGACLVLDEGGAGPAEVRKTIKATHCTVAGLVPSVLEALDEGERDLQSLRLVFTWGEALHEATAKRWACRVALLDLLIATEYWLILFAEHRVDHARGCGTSCGGGFRPVPGARLTLLPPTAEEPASGRRGGPASPVEEVPEGEVGELYLAGPMVGAIGYTDAARNEGAFVDLIVSPDGPPVRHFRTRDLARRRADGSLEYCGRADGFAKVGGRWLDLASVEGRLRSAGCKEAVLVWDHRAKQRHAAVVLPESRVSQRSLAAQVAALQRLVPRETHLHVLADLPRHPTTGKVHRGVLAPRLAAAVPDASPQAEADVAVLRVRRSLLVGLLLAARTGARGALLVTLAWRLAPGLLNARSGRGFLAGLPEGFAFRASTWAGCHRALSGLPLSTLKALPHVALLLLDASATGLRDFRRCFDGPLGHFGAALMVCQCAPPWLRALLAAAGEAHARRTRGGRAWLWVFWVGLPVLVDQWRSDHWPASKRGAPWSDLPQILQTLGTLLRSRGGAELKTALPELSRCSHCWRWAAVDAGTYWRDKFYCADCTEGWQSYKTQKAAEGQPVASPEPTPPASRDVWEPGVDIVDFQPAEVEEARARAPTASSGVATAPEAAPGAATPVGRVLERSTGISASDPAAVLTGIESLKMIALVTALRRELSLDVGALDVAQCCSLEELERLCASASRVGKGGAADDDGADGAGACGDAATWAIYALPRFWKAPVGWMVRLDAMPNEAAMRTACSAFGRRHVGLRADPWRAMRDADLANLCNNAVPIIAAMRALLGSGRDGGLCDKAAEAFFQVWPRVTVSPDAEAPEVHFDWIRCSTEAELRRHAWMRARSRGFQLPASIAVLVLAGNEAEGGREDAAYLHVAVNHCVCDASCIVPIVGDLLSLHNAALAASSSGGAAAETVALPPLPHSLRLQQERLRRTLAAATADGRDGCDDALDLCHSVFHPSRPGYDHYIKILPGACQVLEAGSATIGVPPDHLLVVALAIAFGRVAEFVQEVKLSLIVPMRDGKGESHLIANLAATRHLTVQVRSRSLLAVAMDLSGRLRRREWGLSDFLHDDGDRLFVNVRSIPRLEGAAPEVEAVDTKKATTRWVRNMVEMFADQERQDSWTLSFGIRNDLDGGAFSAALRRVLWSLAVDPLSPAVCAEGL